MAVPQEHCMWARVKQLSLGFQFPGQLTMVVSSIVFTTYPTSNIQATCRFLVGSKSYQLDFYYLPTTTSNPLFLPLPFVSWS